MFIRYFLDLGDPYDRVEAALLSDPWKWIPGEARAADNAGEQLLSDVGFAVTNGHRVDKRVEISFGQPVCAFGQARLPLSWSATGPARLFPSFEADLEIAARTGADPDLDQRALPPTDGKCGAGIRSRAASPCGRGDGEGLLGQGGREGLRSGPRHGVQLGFPSVSTEKARNKPPLRVLLVDDHEVVRDGVRALLQATDDIIVTAEAGSVREAVDEAERARPDVVVMDVRLVDGSGIEATREIRANHPKTAVIMLTSFADDEALFASIMAGASGYVLKQVKGGELVRAIRTVGKGESLLDPAVTNAVLERLRKGKHLLRDEKLARLSPQEERILSAVADGKTNKEIGDELHLAEKTVKNYVSSILSKLEVARRAEAAAYLARHTTTPGTPA
jgi:two-component system, NarL family, response regulator DevR